MWFVLSLLTAVFDAVQQLFQKRGVTNQKLDKEISSGVAACACYLYSMPIVLPLLFWYGIPKLDATFALIMGAVIILLSTSSVLKMTALKNEDLSIVFPILSMTSLGLIFTSARFYGEPLTIPQTAVVLLGIFGVYVIFIDRTKATAVSPFLQPLQKLASSKGAKVALVVLAIYTIGASLDKAAISHSSPQFYAFSMHAGALAVLLPIVWYRTGSLRPIIFCGKDLVIAGAVSGLAQICQYTALPLTTIVHVFAVKRVGVIVTVLLGGMVLKEQNLKYRLTGSIITVVSALLLYYLT